jgi:hypothetical protein
VTSVDTVTGCNNPIGHAISLLFIHLFSQQLEVETRCIQNLEEEISWRAAAECRDKDERIMLLSCASICIAVSMSDSVMSKGAMING